VAPGMGSTNQYLPDFWWDPDRRTITGRISRGAYVLNLMYHQSRGGLFPSCHVNRVGLDEYAHNRRTARNSANSHIEWADSACKETAKNSRLSAHHRYQAGRCVWIWKTAWPRWIEYLRADRKVGPSSGRYHYSSVKCLRPRSEDGTVIPTGGWIHSFTSAISYKYRCDSGAQ